MVGKQLTRQVTKTYVDVETGESFVFATEEALKKRPPRDMRSLEPFGMIFPDAVAKLATMGLTSADWNVLIHLVGIMGFEDAFRYSSKEIGAALGLKTGSIKPLLFRARRSL